MDNGGIIAHLDTCVTPDKDKTQPQAASRSLKQSHNQDHGDHRAGFFTRGNLALFSLKTKTF